MNANLFYESALKQSNYNVSVEYSTSGSSFCTIYEKKAPKKHYLVQPPIYPGSRGSLRGERNENGEPLLTSIANPTFTCIKFLRR
jgi:hypothetical protein